MRTTLISAITTALTTLTQFSVSQELPWSQNGDPLYLKNRKKVYVDNETYEETTLFPVFNGADVFDNDYTCQVYLACDAKNPPTQLNQAISNILACKSSLVDVSNSIDESDYIQEISEDTQILTFTFRMRVTTT